MTIRYLCLQYTSDTRIQPELNQYSIVGICTPVYHQDTSIQPVFDQNWTNDTFQPGMQINMALPVDFD